MGVCFDWTLRLMGPLLLLFATGLISCVICMYFKFILPATATFGSIPVRQTYRHSDYALLLLCGSNCTTYEQVCVLMSPGTVAVGCLLGTVAVSSFGEKYSQHSCFFSLLVGTGHVLCSALGIVAKDLDIPWWPQALSALVFSDCHALLPFLLWPPRPTAAFPFQRKPQNIWN